MSEPQVKKKTSLGKNTLIYTIGNMAYLASQQILLIVIARLSPIHNLDPAVMLGVFAAARALSVPIFTMASLNLRRVIAVGLDFKYRFSELLALRIVALVVSMAAIIGSSYTRPSQEFWIFVLVALTAVFDSISDLIYGVFQEKEMMMQITISRILQGTLQSLSLAVAFWLSGSLLMAVLACFLFSAAVTFAYDIPTLRKIRRGDKDLRLTPEFNGSRMFSIFKLAFPVAISATTGTLLLNAPRYFIEQNLGLAQLGIFSVYTSIMMILAQAQGGFGHAASPRLAKQFVSDRAAFRKTGNKLLVSSLVSTGINVIVALFFGDWIIKILYGQIAFDPQTFLWLMLGHGVYYIKAAANDIATASHTLKGQNAIHLWSCIAAVIAAYFWVPQYGLLGGAYSVFLGRSLMAIAFLVMVFGKIYRLPDTTPVPSDVETELATLDETSPAE